MITHHIMKDNQILLYFDYSYELGSFDHKEKKGILKQVYDYLKNTKINIDGKKILLMVGSTLVATLIYTNGMMRLDSIDSMQTNSSQVAVNVDIPKMEDVSNQTDIIEEQLTEKNESEIQIDKNDYQTNEIKPEKNNASSTVVKPEKNNTLVTQSKPEKNHKKDSKVEIEQNNSKQEQADIEKKDDGVLEKKENLVTVYRSNGTILKIEMEEYIVGVVAAEMPASFNVEALKAQAVLARTYALKKQARGEKLTDTVSTQSYIDISQMKVKWGSDYQKYYNKIVSAVTATRGEYLTYNGEYIEAVYHSTSNGYTEDSVNVWGKSYPYLKSVESSWDKSASSYLKINSKETLLIMNMLGINYDENTEISIISRNNSGRVSEIKIGNNIYTGVEFRNILGLRSSDFDLEVNGDILIIITRGFGHGVGMSQYGANGMAKEGYSYKDIINHYYNGVKLNT